MMRRVLLAVVAVLAASIPAAMAAAATEPVVLHRGNGAEPDSLDPHLAEGRWENQIIGDMIMGLFTEDAQGEPVHGAAESHTVSDDGLVWTFKIRPHTWSDGVPVTAEDFVFAFRRILAPATQSKYANLTFVIKGAQAINSGTAAPETLGVVALDPQTLQITLEHPAPYLPQLLTHYTCFPVPRHAVEAHGDDWVKPGVYVGNGPFTLAEWRPNDRVRLVKNAAFYDADAVKIDEVIYYPTEDLSAALKRFRAGELHIQDGIASQELDWIRQNIPDTLKLEPTLTLSYIALNVTDPALADRRVREALNLAFDRETIATKMLKFGEDPAYALVPPKTAGYPGGTGLPIDRSLSQGERVLRAQALMREAGFGPDAPLALRFETGSSIDNRRVAAAIQQMWKEIYVDLELRQSETKTLYSLLQEGDYQVSQAGWVADYNDAQNFLFLFRRGNPINYSRWSSDAFEALMDESDRTIDGPARQALLARAEQVVLDDFAFIPNRIIKSRWLVQPTVKGFVANLRNINRTRWLSVERSS